MSLREGMLRLAKMALYAYNITRQPILRVAEERSNLTSFLIWVVVVKNQCVAHSKKRENDRSINVSTRRLPPKITRSVQRFRRYRKKVVKMVDKARDKVYVAVTFLDI